MIFRHLLVNHPGKSEAKTPQSDQSKQKLTLQSFKRLKINQITTDLDENRCEINPRRSCICFWGFLGRVLGENWRSLASIPPHPAAALGPVPEDSHKVAAEVSW